MPHSLCSELTLAFKHALTLFELQHNSKQSCELCKHGNGKAPREAPSGLDPVRGVNVIPAARLPA